MCEEKFVRVFPGRTLNDARISAGYFCASLVKAAGADMRRTGYLAEFDQACKRAWQSVERAIGRGEA